MLRPVSDSIIVQPMQADEVTPGGIVVPDIARQAHAGLRGLVVAVGPGAWTISGARLPMSVKVGDVVLLARGGMLIDEAGKTYAVVQDRDILAVVERPKTGELTGARELNLATP